MSHFVLSVPLAGWVSPLEEVPDEVFASHMMGDGVAIDPVGNVLTAPCDGTVMSAAAHAITLRAENGAEILMHIGLESVALKGAGFRGHVQEGDFVHAGDALITIDLAFLADRVKSLMTPVLVTNAEKFRLTVLASDVSANVGVPLLSLDPVAPEGAETVVESGDSVSLTVVCQLHSGLHARPAARIARIVKDGHGSASLTAHDRQADGASVAALMALGIGFGDAVDVVAPAAMVDAICALLATPEAEAPAPVVKVSAPAYPDEPDSVQGICAAPGRAVGALFHLSATGFDVAEDGRGVDEEKLALHTALDSARRALGAGVRSGSAEADILFAHQALLEDPALLDAAHIAIAAGKSAGFAWRAAVQAAAAALSGLESERLRARMDDFADLEQQVLSRLADVKQVEITLPDQAIVVAESLYPSQLAALDASKIAGIVCGGGGPTSHVALIAASMGLPMLAGIGAQLSRIPQSGEVLLDADGGRLLLAPSPEQLAAERAAGAVRAEAAAKAQAAAGEDCVTADGVRIEVFANLGGKPGEAVDAVAKGAEGCGLLRSEFLFLDRTTPPDEAEQLARYREAADAFKGRPVILRTFDIGADKPAAFMPQPKEDNPALGVRGVRLALEHPDMLRTQLRAALKVRPTGQIRLMLPMVSEISELITVRNILDALEQEIHVPRVSLGIMIETPAAALIAGALAQVADFFSVGTNDLTQYTLAVDRTNDALAGRADGLHPAVLKLIGHAVAGAGDKLVGVCGALAADPLAAPVLIGLGVRELSMPPPAIAAVKSQLRKISLSECQVLAEKAVCAASAAEVRILAGAFLKAKDVG